MGLNLRMAIAAGSLILGTGCDDAPVVRYESYYSIGESVLGVTTVVDSLDVPWEICRGPGARIWFTEQCGRISRFDPRTGERRQLLFLDDTYRMRTSGLLGMALHPDMKNYPYVFVAYTARTSEGTPVSRVMRFTYSGDTLGNPLLILEYEAWSSHFGARVAIAPDGKLMVATGDGAQFGNAQNPSSPHGKILRFNLDGTIPGDNPVAGSPFWAYGFRNPQGLTFSRNGILYGSDHGEATDDEVNRIIRGGNYGWPRVEGYIDREDETAFAKQAAIKEPLIAWTPTVAPAGIAMYGSDAIPEFRNSLLLATLKGNGLRLLRLNPRGDRILSDSVLFGQVFGRLRAVCISPAGEIYVSTSNRDWNPHGVAGEGDDRIIRIARVASADAVRGDILPALAGDPAAGAASKGELLYLNYCASCHQADGRGLKDIYPPLYRSRLVNDAGKQAFIRMVLRGKDEMPSFGFMSDEELAVVLSYVRKRFGPQAGTVSEEEIRGLRAGMPPVATSQRTTPDAGHKIK